MQLPSLTSLKGLGQKSVQQLAEQGITTSLQLLMLMPRCYEDRSRLWQIADLMASSDASATVKPALAGQTIQLVATVKRQQLIRARQMLLKVWVADGSGELLLTFFHYVPSHSKRLVNGSRWLIRGTLQWNDRDVCWQMVHPATQALKAHEAPSLAEHWTPIYPKLPIKPATLEKALAQLLAALPYDVAETAMIESFCQAYHLPDFLSALRQVHRPVLSDSLAALNGFEHPAQQRLIVDELMAHQCAITKVRQHWQHQRAMAIDWQSAVVDQVLQRIGFELTPDQQVTLDDIRQDLSQAHPMNRLCQGDVGSGKTLVAFLSALPVLMMGKQVCLMAPTELLAKQHGDTLAQWLSFAADWLSEPWQNVTLLTSDVTGKARKNQLNAILAGEVGLIVGTHAVFQQEVQFQDLAYIIIDEQHRFGVEQRLMLKQKGQGSAQDHEGERVPHVLLMSATPIPRTLTMTLYGDLDISTIRTLPKGRQQIETRVMPQAKRSVVLSRLLAVIQAEQRQVYWVCPLIEESDHIQATTVQDIEGLLSVQDGLRFAVVHGKMPKADKQGIMQRFASGELDVLVATTVIEVGINVPNATIMIIENAERLGLAQLHQLRGRVGRGHLASQCVLLYQDPLSDTGKQRLQWMRQSQDGFELAQADLDIRGAGSWLGTAQSGAESFHLAKFPRDMDWVDPVHQWLQQDPQRAQTISDPLIERWCQLSQQLAAV